MFSLLLSLSLSLSALSAIFALSALSLLSQLSQFSLLYVCFLSLSLSFPPLTLALPLIIAIALRVPPTLLGCCASLRDSCEREW